MWGEGGRPQPITLRPPGTASTGPVLWHHQDAHEIHSHGLSLTYKAGRAGTNQVSMSAVQLLFERPWCWPLAHPEVMKVFTPA